MSLVCPFLRLCHRVRCFVLLNLYWVNHYGPGVILLQGTCGDRILTLHLNYVPLPLRTDPQLLRWQPGACTLADPSCGKVQSLFSLICELYFYNFTGVPRSAKSSTSYNLSKITLVFFEKKRRRKKKENPKERHLRWSHLRATEPRYWRVYTPVGVQGRCHGFRLLGEWWEADVSVQSLCCNTPFVAGQWHMMWISSPSTVVPLSRQCGHTLSC